MKLWTVSLIFICGTLFAEVAPQSMVTKVIPVHYIQADALAKQLQPLLAKGESITSTGTSLIVNVSQDTMTRIRPVIHDLDVPPVVFDISIHQGADNWLDQANDSVQSYSASSNRQASNSQSVSVMSGQSAFVSMGSDRPVITGVSAGWVTGVSYQQKTETQGFYILPVLQGSRVKITIRRMRNETDETDTQQSGNQYVETTTMVPLNSWSKLGSPAQANNINNQSAGAVSYSANNSYNNQAVLFIKVNVSRQ